MSLDFTTTANLEAVKRLGSLPDSSQISDDSDIVSIMSRELHSDIVPILMRKREDYLLHNYDQAVDTSQDSYEIPTRAIGNKLKDVVLVDSSGREVDLDRIDQSLIKRSRHIGGLVSRRGFYFQDTKVVLFPSASQFGGYTLRQKYFRRPNKLVLTTSAGQITAINTALKKVTLGNVPTSWTTTMEFDFIKGEPSFRSLGDDYAVTNIDTPTKILTFSALPSDISVGDWVAEAGESPIAQIPYEIHMLLEQRTVIKVLEGLTDSEGLAEAKDAYNDMLEKASVLLTPRADDSPKKIVSTNPLFGTPRVRAPWW